MGDVPAARPGGRAELPLLGQLQAPPLQERPAMGAEEAADMAGLFKVLANDTRLRLLHGMARGGEVRVSDLAVGVGMTQQAVSNQLQRLVDRRIVAARRDGNNVYYRIVDPCVPALLELAWCLLDTTGDR